MRIVGKVLKYLVALIVILLAAAYLLPRQVQVERSLEISASAEQVFPHINSLKANAAWSPWMDRDPDMQVTYSGPDAGVGARSVWTSDHPQVGNGAQEIVESVTNERVVTALDFGAQGNATATFTLTEGDTGTVVTWGFDTDMGSNPIGRYMGLMMDSWVGGDFEVGLNRLKALVEGQ